MCRIMNIIIFVFLISLSAKGQNREDWRQTEQQNEKPLSQSDIYNGVTPGSGNQLPAVENLSKKSGIWVTWPGFISSSNGSSRLFLQTTGKLKYTLKNKSSLNIVIDLEFAKVYLGNNRNPLVTSHFNTPLNKAYLKKRGKRLELILEMKVESKIEILQETNPDGYSYFFVDFPAGEYSNHSS